MLGLGLALNKNRFQKLPLDEYKGNLVLGFSYYKLLTSYTGYSVRVRRSSDDAEQDFGFVGNYIDYIGILAFCGAGSGYVSIWYNQYTSGNNATQVVNAAQPAIINTGAFESGGLYFNSSSSQFLDVVNYIELDFGVGVFSVQTDVVLKDLATNGHAICGKRANLLGTEKGWSLKTFTNGASGDVGIYIGNGVAGADKIHFFSPPMNINIKLGFTRDGASATVYSYINDTFTNQIGNALGDLTSTATFKIGKTGEYTKGDIKSIVLLKDVELRSNKLP